MYNMKKHFLSLILIFAVFSVYLLYNKYNLIFIKYVQPNVTRDPYEECECLRNIRNISNYINSTTFGTCSKVTFQISINQSKLNMFKKSKKYSRILHCSKDSTKMLLHLPIMKKGITNIVSIFYN